MTEEKSPFKKKDEIFLNLHKQLIKKWNEDYNKGLINVGIVKSWSFKQKEFVKKERRFVLINENM
jgi:hypothetical protein